MEGEGSSQHPQKIDIDKYFQMDIAHQPLILETFKAEHWLSSKRDWYHDRRVLVEILESETNMITAVPVKRQRVRLVDNVDPVTNPIFCLQKVSEELEKGPQLKRSVSVIIRPHVCTECGKFVFSPNSLINQWDRN